MTGNPFGVFAMGDFAHRSALPPQVVARLRDFAELPESPLVSDFTTGDRDDLARAEFLVTGWDSPVVDAAALELMPRLRLVAHAAGSVKQHLTPDVWRRGIAVSSAASANAEPVAEYTRAAIVLALKRGFVRAADYAGNGTANHHVPDCGYTGRTVGVVGASLIGRRVLELLHGSGFELLLFDPYCSVDEAEALGARSVDLDDLCRRSDVVSIHAPQLPQTHHLIDDRRLGLMRDGAVLINTARGSLVDTEALVDHCRAGRIDAVLDVTDPEPLPADHPLLLLRNVWVTPHIAGAQGSEIAVLGEFAVSEVERFFAGEPLRGKVAEGDLPRLA